MDSLLKTYFLEQVLAHPEHCAVDAGYESLSYKQLNALVQEIVEHIEGLGIYNKAVVVLNDHSVLTYAGILGISFANNAFLPIESSWPPARIADILEQVKPAAFLVPSRKKMDEFLERYPRAKDFLFLDCSTGAYYGNRSSVDLASSYKHIAYILFTSGSTGVPKGVPVSHKNLNAFLRHNTSFYKFGANDRFLQVYELTFDVAYFSFLVPLCIGACCCMLTTGNTVPKYLMIINDLLKRNISIVSMVPTIINLSKKYIRLKTVATVQHCFFIGDVLYHSEAKLWQQFVPNAQIHNYYGPTEATIACADYTWTNRMSKGLANDSVPIGKIFPEVKFLIVNEGNQTVSGTEAGELLLSGSQVINGYIGGMHPENFMTFREQGKEAIYYRTGDLVSLNDEGDLVFHGRIDHQVKLNGYRIELNEIQLAIGKRTGKKVIVTKKKNEDGFHHLIAVIEGNPFSIEDLKEELRTTLPEYMIPSEFVFLAQLPLNENGKIDLRSLQMSDGL